MTDRPTLFTPASRIEARDLATSAWHEAAEGDDLSVFALWDAAVYALKSAGLNVARIYRDGSQPVGIDTADAHGNHVILTFDPMQDGFSYETEGDDALELGDAE